MPKKPTKKDYIPHVPFEKAPKCEASGCKEPGAYKAPKSKELDNYQWLCLEHIREYNKKWDYFKGMDASEIEAFIRDAVTGHRPTWNRETRMRDTKHLQDALYEFLTGAPRKVSRPNYNLPAKVRKSLAVMDMDYPYTLKQLKAQYRLLVKKHHPDVNKGNKLAEEKFKSVAVAYQLLTTHQKTLE